MTIQRLIERLQNLIASGAVSPSDVVYVHRPDRLDTRDDIEAVVIEYGEEPGRIVLEGVD
jgi:hypothetical protein